MTVQDLINILHQCDPNSKVTVWNAYHDCEDENVHVSTTYDADSDSNIHIGNFVFENEIVKKFDDSHEWITYDDLQAGIRESKAEDVAKLHQKFIDIMKKSLNLSDKQIDEFYELAAKM